MPKLVWYMRNSGKRLHEFHTVFAIVYKECIIWNISVISNIDMIGRFNLMLEMFFAKGQFFWYHLIILNIISIILSPEAEFSVSICSTPKLICRLDDGVPRLLITENDASYKSNIYKSRMMWTLYQFKIECIIIT